MNTKSDKDRMSRRHSRAWRLGRLTAMLLLLVPVLRAGEPEDWERDAFGRLCTKYLGTAPPEGASHAEWLDRLLRRIGERLSESGSAGAPAEDVALAALLQARSAIPDEMPKKTAPEEEAPGTRSGEERLIRQRGDISRGQEGIRQAQERLAELPIAERLVLTGDVASVLQAATVPEGPDLTTTVGRARVNFVLRAMSAGGNPALGDGYFFVQMLAAGGASDSSTVGGPASFSALNDIAVGRSRFNESTARGNLYLSKVFYEQGLNLGNSRLLGRVGIINLSDFFDTSQFANNEARQFLNSAFVNSPAFKSGISAPGFMGEYQRPVGRGWLDGVVMRAGYAVSRTDRAFASPIWAGEAELQTILGGRQGNWRFGGSVGNRAGSGIVRGLHVSVDQWVSDRIGVFGRYAVANSGPGSLAFGPVRQSYGAGVQWRFWNGDDRISAWSLGFSQSFGIPTGGEMASERVLESYYRWQWTRNISVTPDIQLILGSGGRKSRGTQAVFGTRLNFVF